MGYYVEITESTFTIPKANLAAAYERMVALNDHDDLKRGGQWPAEDMTADERVATGYNPSKWFSWMEPNYPGVVADTNGVLEMLGFETETDENGDVLVRGYDNKTGQEDIFLTAISDLATGYLVWRGEQGEVWRETYGGEAVIVHEAELTFPGDGSPRTLGTYQR